MIRGVCDKPTRLAARIFVAVGSDCPCCSFWRGFLAGTVFMVAAALVVVAAVHFLAHS